MKNIARMDVGRLGQARDMIPPPLEANSKLPDWAHQSDQDLLRFLFVCPQPCPELDELLGRLG